MVHVTLGRTEVVLPDYQLEADAAFALAECRLELHPTKTKVAVLQGPSARGQVRDGQLRLSRLLFPSSIGQGAVLAEPVLRVHPGSRPKSALNAMRATIRDLNIRTRTEVTLDDIARELDPKVRGWLAYYGQYTRSALYPIARYINQTLAVSVEAKIQALPPASGTRAPLSCEDRA